MERQLEPVLIVMDFALLGIGGQPIMLYTLHLRFVLFHCSFEFLCVW